MPFTRPTLPELRDRTKGDLRTATGVKAIIRRSFLDVLAKAISGVTHTLHGHMVYISKQMFPDQAEDEFLERWGSIYSIGRKAATFAKLNVALTGTDGTNITAGTVYTRDDGLTYQVEAVAVVATGVASVVLICDTEGSTGNLDAGEIVSIQSPIAGLDNDGTVSSTDTEGDDLESDDNYRARVVDRIQQPPSGGTANDYIQYATSVSGVTRAWVIPGGMGEGTVVVYVVEDDEVDILPDVATLAAVQAVLDESAPVTATTFAVSPIAKDLDLTIKIEPNTVAVQEAIKAEIKDLLAREAQVKGGFEEVGSQYDGIIEISKIQEAISIASGEEDHILVSPTEDVVPSQGGLVIEGTYTFQGI